MIKKVKSKFLESVKSKKLNVFLLFMGLSFGILLLTKLSNDYTKTITFSVKKENLPEHLVITADSLSLLNITLKTNGFNLLKYYFTNPSISIDFNTISKNDTEYYCSKNNYYSSVNNQLDKDINIVSITPDTLKFRYDVNEVKLVPIEPNINITFSPGFDSMEGYKLTPDSIKVIGPKNLVDKIESVSTEKVELNNVKSAVQKTVNLVIPKDAGLTFSSKTTTVNEEVERFTEGVVSVPVIITNIPNRLQLKYFPKSVNLTYYTSLKVFNDIGVRDFKIECDYSKRDKNVNFLIPNVVNKPDRIKNLKINQQRIEFIITE